MPKPTKKILIVEDQEMIRKTYADELKDQGFIILVADNGQEGLKIALSEKPDLILLDILMPVMNGMDMMKELRRDSWGNKVPIILLTNISANEKVIEGMLEHEPLYYLIKSDWTLKDVVEQVRKII